MRDLRAHHRRRRYTARRTRYQDFKWQAIVLANEGNQELVNCEELMINFNKLNLTTILLPQFSAFLLSVVRVFCYLHCSLILLLHSQARWLYIFHLRIDRAQELKSFVYQCRECSECLIIFRRRGFCKWVIRKNLDQDSSLIKRHVYGLRVS